MCSHAVFFSVFLVASLSPLLSPRVYMFALGKGGNEGESCSELTLCKTFQRPTLLYPKLCLCQALKCDFQCWTSLHCCILCLCMAFLFSYMFVNLSPKGITQFDFIVLIYMYNLQWLKCVEKTKIWILAATMCVLVPQGPFPFWSLESALLGVRQCQVLPVAVCGRSSPSSGQ